MSDLDAGPGPRLLLKRSGVLWRQVGDTVMLLDTASWQYRAVNATGTALWPLLQRGTTREELVQRLVGGFEVQPDRARQDLAAFLGGLARLGLLEEVPS